MKQKRLVVIGGGAAGFFCAVNAARLNPMLEVIIVEKASKVLSKVRVSGGGRCNVTHSCFSIAELVKKYPRGGSFLKKAFHHFSTKDTIEWFNKRGVVLKTEADGRMFPVSNSAETIIECLIKEANQYKVQVLMNRDVGELIRGNWSMVNGEWSKVDGARIIGPEDEPTSTPGNVSADVPQECWLLKMKDGSSIAADYVCIASGGYPKAAQFEWLQQSLHAIESPVPSLFTFNMPGNAITALMGVTVEDVVVKILGSKLNTRGPLLITHWGMSGPAILRLSAWGARLLAASNWHCSIQINWLPAYNEQTLKAKLQQVRFELAAQKIVNRNPFGLPQRLWQYLLAQSEIDEAIRWADLPAKEQHKLIKNLCVQEFAVNGKTTFKEEFVTAGGVLLGEIDYHTMASKLIPNLYFAGEVIDVDGVTGGFNFQNAWTTGWLSARAIATAAQLATSANHYVNDF